MAHFTDEKVKVTTHSRAIVESGLKPDFHLLNKALSPKAWAGLRALETQGGRPEVSGKSLDPPSTALLSLPVG